jgi:hypothetical protein
MSEEERSVDAIAAQAETGFASVEEGIASIQETLAEVALLLDRLPRSVTEAA